jgi:glucose/arabinose dehydrogenase
MPVNLIVGDDGSNFLQGTAGADLIYGYDPDGPQSQASAILATRVATGLNQPIFAASPPGDTGRLFLVEKTGRIKILDLNSGQVAATPFLNVSGEIVSDGERGLLGLAFDPNFASNGFFYVYLTNLAGDAEIRRYQVSSNPNLADPASVTPILTIDQTNATNHKSGWLGFGPDGNLYIASGDGAVAANAQDVNSLLGKILRIDVHGDDFPADPARNYAVPADNPYVGAPGADEIFALGLRNPWRNSFDRGLGDFYIADVGQNQWEEINLGQNGANYGWPVFEGPAVFAGGTPTGGSACRQFTPTTTALGNRSRAATSIAANRRGCTVSISSQTSCREKCSPYASTAALGLRPIAPRRSRPLLALSTIRRRLGRTLSAISMSRTSTAIFSGCRRSWPLPIRPMCFTAWMGTICCSADPATTYSTAALVPIP